MYSLQIIVFWICMAIGMMVFGLMMYSLIGHRKSKGIQTTPFHKNLVVEMIWAIIPFIILVMLAWPTAKLI